MLERKNLHHLSIIACRSSWPDVEEIAHEDVGLQAGIGL
jgi:hypothetical protein